MGPAFMFVDPYGFKIPTRLLADLMKAGRVELFINVMWRELDMLIQQRPTPGMSHAQNLDDVFGWSSRTPWGSLPCRATLALLPSVAFRDRHRQDPLGCLATIVSHDDSSCGWNSPFGASLQCSLGQCQ